MIKSGVSAGDTLVTDGIDRLTDGAQVEVVSGEKKLQPEIRPDVRKQS